MKFAISRAELVRALTAVARAVERRNTIPILGHVLLVAGDGMLTLRGTDLNVEISTTIPADVSLAGAAAVPADRLSDIVKRMSGDTVDVGSDKHKVTIKSGRSRFSLNSLSADDFPTLSAGDLTSAFELDLAAFVAPIQFAISTEETRYYLNGVHLHVTGEELVAVSTDGHRLAKNSLGIPDGCADMPGVIVPRKTVGLIPKGGVRVELSTRCIRMTSGDTIITSKLIDGTYPDYGRIIPSSNEKLLSVSRERFRQAVSRVIAVEAEKTRSVKFTVANDNVELSVRGQDGEALEDVEANYGFEPIEIGFNGKYLVDVLANLSGDEVRISLNDPGSPTLFQGDGNLLCVVMPMRV